MTRFSDHALRTFGVKLAVLAAALAGSIITSRLLGPEGRGHLALLTLLPAFVHAFGQVGLANSLNHYGGRVERGTLVFNAFLLTAVMAAVATAGALAAALLLHGTIFAGVPMALLVVAASLTAVMLFVDHSTRSLQAIYEIERFNAISLVNPLTYPLLVVLFVGVFGWGLAGAIAAFACSLIVTFVAGGWVLARTVDLRGAQHDPALLQDLLRFGWKAHIGNVFKKLAYRVDLFVVAYFLDAEAVGYYALALSLAELAWKVPESVSDVLLPNLSHQRAGPMFTAAVCRQVILIVALTCLGMFVVRHPLVTIPFGAAFAPAVVPFTFVLPGVFALSILKILAADFNARGEPLKYSLATGVAFGSMLLFDLLLIPRYGIAGAAIASTLGYTMGTVVLVSMYTRLAGVRVRDLLVPRLEDVRYLRAFSARLIARMRGASS